MKRAMKQSILTLILNVVSILLMLASIGMFFAVSSINGEVDQKNEDRYNLQVNAKRFMDGSSYLTNQVRAYAATGDDQYYNNYWDEINRLKNRDIALRNLKDIGLSPEETKMIEEMSDLSNNLVPLEEQAMESTKAGDTAVALEAVYGEYYAEQINKISQLQTDFGTGLEQRSGQEVQTLYDQISLLTLVVYFCLAVTAVLQVLSAIYIRFKVIRPIVQVKDEMLEISSGNLRSEFSLKPDTSEIGMLVHSIIQTKYELNKYINNISENLRAMADGDMTVTIGIEYLGDFASIKQSLNTILQSLNHVLGDIDAASNQIASAASELSNGAQAVSQGAAEQASTVEEISTSINEIAEQSKNSSRQAAEAARFGHTIRQAATDSYDKMEGMITSVQEINDASQAIGNVIKVIDDIAFQTNILALNAAVEAARAGEHGKGFAVVADEVRNLAGKSAEAAKETAELISANIEKAGIGMEMARDTSASLQEIVDGIGKTSESLNEIARQSEASKQATGQVNLAVDQVSQVVQQNSATSEQSAAASEEMNSQAQYLQTVISQFKLRGNNDKGYIALPRGNSLTDAAGTDSASPIIF